LAADLWNKYIMKQKIFTPEEWEEYRNDTKEEHGIE
jgi:hypothetical protein